MISCSTIVKNRLKYSATSPITIIINQSLQPNLISSINIHNPMKGKPLINEANLHKISKTQQFLVRSKTNLLKTQRLQKSQKNIDPDSIPTELQYCIQSLQSFLQEGKQITKEQGDRLYKLLLTLKNRSSLLEAVGNQQELDDSPLLVLRHSESKYFGKIKNQTLENTSEVCDSHEKLVIQQSKIRPSKMKFGKENGSKAVSMYEMKIDRLQLKIAQQQKIIEQYKEKVNSVSQQLRDINWKFLQLQGQRQRLSDINTQFHSKITSLIQEKIISEDKLSAKMIQFDNQTVQYNQKITVLRERLENRQMELVSLFRQYL